MPWTEDYRIEPDDKYWAIARLKTNPKAGTERWYRKSWYQTLEEAAVALLNLAAAKKAEEPYDLAALLEAVRLAEAHTVEAVVNATNLPAQLKAMGLDAPAPNPN